MLSFCNVHCVMSVPMQENEMEIPRSVAERKLREHKGDVVQALVELTN